MKKLLTTIIALTLCLSMALFTACGSKSYFDGNYKESSVDEVQTYAQEELTDASEEIDLYAGVKIVMKLDMEGNKMDVALNLSKDPADDTKYVMSADYYMEMSMGGDTQIVDMELVYKDGNCYAKLVEGENEIKTKIATAEVDDAIGELGMFVNVLDGMMSQYDLASALSIVGEYEGLKVYMDKGNDLTKIKIAGDISEKEDGKVMSGKMELVYVYNAQKKFVGLKVYMTSEVTENGETTPLASYDISIEPWTGDVELPSDAADYVAE